MCGISGAFWGKEPPQASTLLYSSLNSISKRGPDDQGIFLKNIDTGLIALGHNRLSIIDLSNAGHQPIHSSCGSFILIFNGEIYNYIELKHELTALGKIFLTNTDTEVLLIAWQTWGTDCISKLFGMFAFAIFDVKNASLYCVRDLFGIKPFYYNIDSENFVFSSEICGVQKLNNELNEFDNQIALDYLLYGKYDHTEKTFVKNIKKLPSGHYLKIELINHKININKYKWWNPSTDKTSTLTFTEAADKLKNLFLDSISLHSRSDVPIAASLSGGLDSSAIVYALRKLSPDSEINTFSYIAPNYSNNEEYWIDAVNKDVFAKSHKVSIAPQEFLSDFDELILCQGEPFRSSSIYAEYRVYKEAKNHGFKVIFAGHGADEALGGYDGYPQCVIKSLLNNKEYTKLIQFVINWPKWPNRKIQYLYIQLLKELIPKEFTKFIIKLRKNANNHHFINHTTLSEYIGNLETRDAFDSSNTDRPYINRLKSELTGDRISRQLRYADRSSMHSSIEARVPFLSKDLVEFIFSLEEQFIYDVNGQTKNLFRYAMKGIIPDKILFRRDKVGFETPDNDYINIILNQDWINDIDGIKIFDADRLRILINNFKSSSYDASFKWRLFNLIRYYQLMNFEG